MTTLGTWSAFFELLGSFAALWIMQSVTADFNLCSKIGVVKFFHRAAFCGLAITMAANAAYTLTSDTDPRLVDLVEQIALFLVLSISASRHIMVLPKAQQQGR